MKWIRRNISRSYLRWLALRDILIINKDNQLIRLNVPFTVLVVREVPGLSEGDLGSVTAIRMDIRLIDIYVVNGKLYYYYNFVLWID